MWLYSGCQSGLCIGGFCAMVLPYVMIGCCIIFRLPIRDVYWRILCDGTPPGTGSRMMTATMRKMKEIKMARAITVKRKVMDQDYLLKYFHAQRWHVVTVKLLLFFWPYFHDTTTWVIFMWLYFFAIFVMFCSIIFIIWNYMYMY